MTEKVQIDHFSDTLCVWAYVSQIRLDELRAELGDRISISYHFINMFGNTDKRIAEGWQDRGGYAGFGDHVLEVGRGFPHVEINPDVWRMVRPRSSAMSHLFLKSVQLLEDKGEVPSGSMPEYNNQTLFERAIWLVRHAFFNEARDIGQLAVLMSIADQLDLPRVLIEEQLTNGEAMAALCSDLELRDTHRLEGSPTYLLNSGRQKLYGNVGYRIIEANVLELLEQPQGQASWC
ncbi:MAG: disulfide bond formation protein DsbA [Gammaproteobacteria bacterium]|nr:disulfide bond formation protein DsbA [Gammaproteobacteria bacterium]